MFSKKLFPISIIFSVLLHIIFAIMMMYYSFEEAKTKVETIEMSWGPSPSDLSNEMDIANLESGNPQDGESSSSNSFSEETIELPSIKSLNNDEKIFTTKKEKKSDDSSPINFNPSSTKKNVEESSEKTSSTSSIGKKPQKEGRGSEDATDAAAPFGKGSVSIGAGKNVSYDIEWTNNLIRNLEVFSLPKYPAGANISTQIKLRLFVEPSGFISDVQVLQKGNTQLENVAIRDVKKWKFESLQSGQTQKTQSCVVTFRFVLK